MARNGLRAEANGSLELLAAEEARSDAGPNPASEDPRAASSPHFTKDRIRSFAIVPEVSNAEVAIDVDPGTQRHRSAFAGYGGQKRKNRLSAAFTPSSPFVLVETVRLGWLLK